MGNAILLEKIVDFKGLGGVVRPLEAIERIDLLFQLNYIRERFKNTDNVSITPGSSSTARILVFFSFCSIERNLSLTELVNSEIKKRMEKEKCKHHIYPAQ